LKASSAETFSSAAAFFSAGGFCCANAAKGIATMLNTSHRPHTGAIFMSESPE